MLDGAASSQGNLYAYQWSTPDGLILVGAQSLAATAGAPGQYELLVTNLGEHLHRDGGDHGLSRYVGPQRTDRPPGGAELPAHRPAARCQRF
jgi:hypothetical protein